MKRISLIIIVFRAMLSIASAQELTVKEMKATNDISASQYRVNDLNGQPCALVKVQVAAQGVKFEGNIIPPVKYDAGEYWVYMTAGSKELRIKGSSFVASHVVFGNYGIDKLEPLQTYNLTLLMPQGGAVAQTQKLIINYTPASAIVIVDSKTYTGNGRVELTLPVGSHDYQIVAAGYDPAEGSVKLNVNSPRTINETLVTATQQTSQAQSQSVMTSESAVETFTVNGVSFNMVRVDGGTFTMGATSEQGSDAESDEKPAHQVMLSTYSIGETEVKQALWQAAMGSNPSDFEGDNLPVEKVSWDDCQTFISKLNAATGKRFRLPTEAEWEYAARGGNKSRGYKYSGSNSIDDVAWSWENSGDSRLSGKWKSEKLVSNNCRTHPVKTKQPNELGLYDMSGNVYEWCQDWYGSYSSSSKTNPTGPSSGSYRVFRGGSWFRSAGRCRSSYRSGDVPSDRFSNLGLRLAF